MISSRIKAVKPSMTLSIAAKARALKEEGKPVISLAMGEPDFDTPMHIKEAGRRAIQEGNTKYTPVAGIEALRQAIVEKCLSDNRLTYQRDQVIVCSGAKQVLYNLLGATIDQGDEVIIPVPCWVSYIDMVVMFGGKPVLVPTDDNFLPDPQLIQQAITANTKWLVLNYPNNPTGACIDLKGLEAIGELMKRNPHVGVISDDIYEYIVYDDNKFYNLATVVPELQDRVFIVNGVSKGYSMTGWRIGYGAGNQELIKAMSTLQSQSTSCPCSISQHAAVAALTSPRDFFSGWLTEFRHRRDMMLSRINNEIPGMTCEKPGGAFYLFPSISKLLGRKTPKGQVIQNDIDFADYLISDHALAVVPGVAFGHPNHFRLSYAASESVLEAACLQLQKACRDLE